ncbi:xanthine dehydrogenase subunit XdhC [Spirochaeta thermophila]|uniref:Ferredoxin n=1 Tax=Winmispira thermophila (strain ATCC 49972 / DSM 6192 / RI 19.B1) TaxID=665571 RepID=E0RRX3_WINT6|nr:xanthine dehydrogenase subunit XdhC [Spirochaeta thermophila]ADN01760.1 hypothetical protein STHERM_c08110 [Spirochaeta thermophila DSM 6192]
MLLTCELDHVHLQQEVDPLMDLHSFLKSELRITAVKGSCGSGYCGRCGVLIDDVFSLACMVPLFSVQQRRILTIAGFSSTPDYVDLEKGFHAEKVFPCGHCAPSRILLGHSLLVYAEHHQTDPRGMREHVERFPCTCITPEEYTRALVKALRFRQRRYGHH